MTEAGVDRIRYKWVFLFFTICCLSSCKKEVQLFEQLSSAHSGIHFKNEITPTDNFNIIDYPYFYNGAGVAVGDINADGLPDIFFSGNQLSNRLYLNRGNLQFEDITLKAGISGTSSWKTGSVMVDINGDGLLDIYVCAVVGIRNLRGHNELFINNGDNTFTERSAEFGLDFQTFCSSAAFLDYDLDGDLDVYLLNHAVHTMESFGHASLRNNRTYETGGKLLRNDGNTFKDVSEEAKIYGGVNGYGLGVAISDFNLDGYPDIFVGNDFHEDDYLYMNNGNGTFSEKGRESLTMMSKFSMGNDVADINHDGLPDLITLDMLPENEEVLKRSVDEENISIMKLRTEKYGYYYQFPRNMLQINQGNGQFTEAALLGNVAATDWSWSALFADYDQDGHQDLFISNGIPKRPNDLDYIKYASSKEVSEMMSSTRLADESALSLMPAGQVRNYIYRGTGGYTFHNMSENWLPKELTCSTATALADLDNDGDLDIVISNVNAESSIYVNQSENNSKYLKIHLRDTTPNTHGIGAKIYSYHKDVMQFKELYSVRGFQSSSEPMVHFGYGQENYVDSLVVVWPNGRMQKLEKVETNQTLVISYDKASKYLFRKVSIKKPLFQRINPKDIGIDFTHKEDAYTDFDRLKLIPYQLSDRGPATALGDIDGDGLMDMYFGGSKFVSGQFYVLRDTGFERFMIPEILKDSIKEDVDAVIADFNGDGKSDLFIGTGGADFFNQSTPLLDSYYYSTKDSFVLKEVLRYYENASCVRAFDFDEDGDLDVFVGNQSVSNDFGKIPRSYLLRNDNGELTPIQTEVFEDLGMVTDAIWSDFNADGLVDLVVIGEWMSPIFISNQDGIFVKPEQSKEKLNGLWQSILPFDIDGDGDTDYLLGNWGLNSKFVASEKYPLKMYYYDFDSNGKSETILTMYKNSEYYPIESLDILASQIPSLRKKFPEYKLFAGKPIEEVFTNTQLSNAQLFTVQQLASGYLKNTKGNFQFVSFPFELQTAPIMAFCKYDYDLDGSEEVVVGGNYFGVQPYHGRFGSFPGALIENDSTISIGHSIGLDFFNSSVRHLNVVSLNGKRYLLATTHNDRIQIYKLLK